MKKNSFELYHLDINFNQGKQVQSQDINYLKLIAKGSLAKVYKISLKSNPDKFYALKIISYDQLLRLDIQDYLQQEIKILSTCDHQNIIKLYTAFLQDDYVYMIMEYAQKGNLFQKIKKYQKFNEQKTVKYMKDIIMALVYLHSKNPPILHRDIKPENILICQNGLKIADFGWSNFKTDIRNTYCGTADYLSPEMILGTNHNEKTDIWSLGVLLYELLHGKPCFQPKNMPSNNRVAKKMIEKNILKAKVKMDCNLSLKAKTAISLMLNPDSNQRPYAKDLLGLEFFCQDNKQEQKYNKQMTSQQSINLQLQKAYQMEVEKVQKLTILLHKKDEQINQQNKQNQILQDQIQQVKRSYESMIEEYKKISVSTKESEKRKSQNRQQNLDSQIQILQTEMNTQKRTNLVMFEKSQLICNLVNKLYNQKKQQNNQILDREKDMLSFDDAINQLKQLLDQEPQNRSNSCRNINLNFQNKGYTFQNIKFENKLQIPQFQEFYGYQKHSSLNRPNYQNSMPRTNSNFNL